MIQRSMTSTDHKTKLTLFNGAVLPILEYASQVWSPHTKGLIRQLDMVHRRGVRWIYHLEKLDSVSQTMQQHHITTLEDRRRASDLAFLGKIECGLYDLDLRDYLHFNTTHDTRGGTINPHYSQLLFKNSYFNRMRPDVKLTHNKAPSLN